MSSRPTRILVIRFSSIGDIVLTAPAIASLRAAIHGPCEVHFLTKSNMRSVAEGLGPLVDHIHTIDSSTAEVTQILKSTGIDYIVDLHSNVRSRSIKKALGCIAFTLKKENLAKWLLVRGWRKETRCSHRRAVHRCVSRCVRSADSRGMARVICADWASFVF